MGAVTPTTTYSGSLRGEGSFWLVLLILLQILCELFVFSYKSTWKIGSRWDIHASEWLDYYSYWGHHFVNLSLLQILFPALFRRIPILKHVDFVKINICMLINTTLMWQGPRVGRYFMREHWTYEFFINSMQHGGNLLCLAMFAWKSKRPLRDSSFLHTLTVPLCYALFILYRVSTAQSQMRYYLPEGMGTVPYTAVVGAMWIVLQFVTELVVLQVVMNVNRIPKVWAQAMRSVSVLRSQVLSAQTWEDFSERVQQHEELALAAPIFRKLSKRKNAAEEQPRGTRMHSRVIQAM